jgi:hypothetical protein
MRRGAAQESALRRRIRAGPGSAAALEKIAVAKASEANQEYGIER